MFAEQYDWTMFVEDLDDCVQNVRFQLHPTFKPSEVMNGLDLDVIG